MTDTSYILIRQICMGLLLYLGIHMLFAKLPKQLKNSFYDWSFRAMGAAFLFVPLSCFLYTPDKTLEMEPYISAAVNLTAYFATFVLMVSAFLILLGKRLGKNVQIAIVATIILFPIPMWISIFSGNAKIIDTIITAYYSLFIIALIYSVVSVLRNYSKASKNIDNYYSDDLHIYVSWIRRSIWLLLGLAINCGVSPLLPISPWWLRAFFLIYGLLCFMHIHYGYRRMMIAMIDNLMLQGHKVHKLAIVEQQKSDSVLSISGDIESKIEAQINIWISDKRYTQ